LALTAWNCSLLGQICYLAELGNSSKVMFLYQPSLPFSTELWNQKPALLIDPLLQSAGLMRCSKALDEAGLLVLQELWLTSELEFYNISRYAMKNG